MIKSRKGKKYDQEIDGISPINPKRIKLSEGEENIEILNKTLSSNQEISNLNIELTNSELRHKELEIYEEGLKSSCFSRGDEFSDKGIMPIIKLIAIPDDVYKNGEEKKCTNSHSKTQTSLDNISPQSEKSTVSESSFFTVNKAQTVTCQLHGYLHINVDKLTFKLFCEQCRKDGFKKSRLDLKDDKKQKKKIKCDCCNDLESVLFCEDCNIFLCKSCCCSFGHQNHNCNIPGAAVKAYKENISKIHTDFKDNLHKIQENHEDLAKLEMKIKTLREVPDKVMRETIKVVENSITVKFDSFYANFEEIFEKYDEKVSHIVSRLQNLSKQIIKYIQDINEFVIFISKMSDGKIDSCVDVCIMKHSKALLFDEIKLVLAESKNLVDTKIPKLKKDLDGKIVIFDKNIYSLVKKVKLMGDTVLKSVLSGMNSQSFFMRRFNKFLHLGLTYYKSSSLILKVNRPVFLIGFGLCGLYFPHIKTINQNGYPELVLVNDLLERDKLKFEIKVSELENSSHTSEMTFVEYHQLKGIINPDDPVFTINLDKAKYLRSEVKYLITIANCESNMYVDLWAGEVNKTALANLHQDIKCNCTNVDFSFEPAIGVESDFNEFNSGLIANIIFTQVE